MCLQLIWISWIRWYSIAYMHTCTAFSLLSFYRLIFLYIPIPANSSLHLNFVHLCSLSFFFILLLLKCETALNATRYFLLLLPCGLPGKIGKSGTGVHVGLQLLIKNQHCPVCHEVRNLSGLLCGWCTDPYEDILHCQLQHKHKKIRKKKVEDSLPVNCIFLI